MTIIPIRAFIDNYIWAIIEKKDSSFYCVDPGDAEPVLEFSRANKLTLSTILLTHHHNDHIGGVRELVQTFPSCIVYGPQDTRIPYVNIPVCKYQKIQVGQQEFTILYNPGHTSSHISYYEQKQEWLFCGDTLFSAGCGRVFDGTLEQLYQSLMLFKSLPPSTQIFCAHEYTEQNLRFAQTVEPNNRLIQNYLEQFASHSISCSLPSKLSQELSINPFLRTDEPEVQNYALKHGAISNNALEIFRVLRTMKNEFN